MDDLTVMSMTTEEESIYCVRNTNVHRGAPILAYELYQHPNPPTSSFNHAQYGTYEGQDACLIILKLSFQQYRSSRFKSAAAFRSSFVHAVAAWLLADPVIGLLGLL